MKKLLLSLMLFLPISAYAHDVDNDQLKVAHLSLNNPTYFSAWFNYWHERRLLATLDIASYVRCIGAVKQLRSLLKLTGDPELYEITRYWDVIPAIPLETYPGDLTVAAQQLTAAKDTRYIVQVNASICDGVRYDLENKVKAKMK